MHTRSAPPLASPCARACCAARAKLSSLHGAAGGAAALAAASFGDPAAAFDVAKALAATGKQVEAADALLSLMRSTKPDWSDGAARKMLLQIFDSLGPTHPATVAGRRQLSKLLFR